MSSWDVDAHIGDENAYEQHLLFSPLRTLAECQHCGAGQEQPCGFEGDRRTNPAMNRRRPKDCAQAPDPRYMAIPY